MLGSERRVASQGRRAVELSRPRDRAAALVWAVEEGKAGELARKLRPTSWSGNLSRRLRARLKLIDSLARLRRCVHRVKGRFARGERDDLVDLLFKIREFLAL